MKVEIVVPVWGAWLEPWYLHVLPSLRAEAASIGASIVVYSDEPGRAALSGDDRLELRVLTHGGDLDAADNAHGDALVAAAAGGYAVAPLMANMVPGRGTFVSARHWLDLGYRAVMAINLPTPMPSPDLLAAHARPLAAWMGRAAGLLYWGQPTSHPGHYAWRAGDAALVRAIYLPPVLIRPMRAVLSSRAMDHFLVEEVLDRPDQVAYLDPAEGCLAGISLQPHSPDNGLVEQAPVFGPNPARVAEWMLAGNARSWNIHHMAQRFWCGDPGPDRDGVETASDSVVNEIVRAFQHGNDQGRRQT